MTIQKLSKFLEVLKDSVHEATGYPHPLESSASVNAIGDRIAVVTVSTHAADASPWPLVSADYLLRDEAPDGTFAMPTFVPESEWAEGDQSLELADQDGDRVFVRTLPGHRLTGILLRDICTTVQDGELAFVVGTNMQRSTFYPFQLHIDIL